MKKKKKISINDFELCEYIETMQPLQNYSKYNYWYMLRHFEKTFNMTLREIKKIYLYDLMQRLKPAPYVE